MEKNISFITLKRNKAKIEFEEDFYKLLNNSFYGKTTENVPNKIKVEFIKKDDIDKMILKNPNWLSMEFISHMKIMIVIQSNKTKF